MDITTPSGYTVVDTPLPYAILDTYVDEKYLSEEIDSLWANRQSYSRAIHAQKAEMRGFEKTLGEMLFTMKSILSKPGRGGGWSAWLKQRTIPIPRASADRIVQNLRPPYLAERSCLTMQLQRNPPRLKSAGCSPLCGRVVTKY